MKKAGPASRTPEKRLQRKTGSDQAEQPENLASEDVLEGVVERRLEPVLSNLSKVQREQVISTVVRVVQAESFSGPIPHPRHLKEYDLILPGAAERLVRMTEQAVHHNITSLAQAQKDDHVYRTLGMILGFLALILLVVAAVYAGMNGNNILAGLLLGTSVLSSIGVFVSAHLKGVKR